MSPVHPGLADAPLGRRRPPAALTLCLALTLVLHLAVGWALWHRPAVVPADTALRVRLVVAPHAASGGRTNHAPARAHVDAQPPALDPLQAAVTPWSDAPGQDAIAQLYAAASDAPALTEAPYFSRQELDTGPSPQDAVVIPFPASTADIPHRSGVLTLFIDEIGTVQRVAFDDAELTLTPAMQQATRTALLGVRFNPGQKDGLAVRSRIDIEVSFDLTPAGDVAADAQRNGAPQPARSGA